MEVLRFGDAGAFLERAMPLLAPDADAEARHNLILGISGTVADHPDLHETYRAWLALEDGKPLAAATRTPPFNAVLDAIGDGLDPAPSVRVPARSQTSGMAVRACLRSPRVPRR